MRFHMKPFNAAQSGPRAEVWESGRPAPKRPRPKRVAPATIGQIAKEFGVTPRALRFYEDKGLLSPARLGANRLYGSKERARLALILRGKRVGLSLEDIREILDVYSRDDGGAAQMALSLARFEEKIVELERQRLDIEQAIKELKDGSAWLKKKLRSMGDKSEQAARAYERAARASLAEDQGGPGAGA